jgi:hypothetical protein
MVAPYARRHPLLISLANEYISYIPTDEERLLGGYEPSVAITAPGAPDSLAKGAQALLKRVYGE